MWISKSTSCPSKRTARTSQRNRDYKAFIAQLPTLGRSLLICIKIGEHGRGRRRGGGGRGAGRGRWGPVRGAEEILNTRSDYDFAGESAGEKMEEKVAKAFKSSNGVDHGSASCFFISLRLHLR